MFRKAWTIARKDILAELRSREMLSTMGAFSVLIILMFAFTFDLRVAKAGTVAPGVLWAVIAFAGMLGLGRSLSKLLDGDRSRRAELVALRIADERIEEIGRGRVLLLDRPAEIQTTDQETPGANFRLDEI